MIDTVSDSAPRAASDGEHKTTSIRQWLERTKLSITASRPTEAPAPSAQRRAGDAVAVTLAGIGALHAAWGAGITKWPGTDARSLAEKVVGGSTFPSSAACYVVAGLLATGSALCVLRNRTTDPNLFALSHLGTSTVGSVLLLRGVGGLLASGLGLGSQTAAFRQSNLLLYSPLCIVLGAAAIWSAKRQPPRIPPSA